MKRIACASFISMILALLDAVQSQTTSFQLRLELRTDSVELFVDGSADSGAFFLYQAHSLELLRASPSVMVLTNTPLTNGLRFSVPTAGALLEQAFFTAAHWPGRAVDEFCGGSNMVFIPGGAFAMGDAFNDSPDASGERPVHAVFVSG